MELPADFIHGMNAMLQEDELSHFLEALAHEPSVSIRVNEAKSGLDDLLSGNPSITPDGRVPWVCSGVYLKERPDFTSDPLLHAGCYYVQEASSMFLEQAVRTCASGPVTMLDLCAAPGGKTTHLCSLLPHGSLLVANEINRSRAAILAENVTKWGAGNVLVTNDTPERIGRSSIMFDIILTDVPCSGEGMFRKDPVAISEWSPANVRMCADRQREILRSIWDSLKPGGHLIYSTCTYNSNEDENNVRWMMNEFGAEPVGIDTAPEWNVAGALDGSSMPVYHFMQHRTRGEGFFLALLKKPGEAAGINMRSKMPKSEDGEFRTWISNPDSYIFDRRDSAVFALPAQYASLMQQVSSEIHTIVPGLQIAVQKGHDWTPAHALSMSSEYDESAFPQCELDLSTALKYLHLEAIHLEGMPKGYVSVRYKGHRLGFVKNIGNRANNLYPPNWRIRKSI